MNCEFHLFIIWSNAEKWKDQIIDDIKNRFHLLGKHRVSWNKDHFSNNLTRFYGENLPKNSNKEKRCGNESFTLITVLDRNPVYRSRKTSKGTAIVNSNMFDSKEMYRHWTGGGHLIHGTNTVQEAKHDIIMLTGYSAEEYLKRIDTIIDETFCEIPGEKTWKNLNQVFNVLNETTNYVVLRNYDYLLCKDVQGFHNDIDILTDHYSLTKLVLNGEHVFHSNYRVQNSVMINGKSVHFDIRFIGDNYYCSEWEKAILFSRYFDRRGFYIPNEENYIYSLLYHALIHKTKISHDYWKVFQYYFKNKEMNELNLIDNLEKYLKTNHYYYCEPDDYSVYFNKEITKRKMSNKKFLLKAFHKVIG